jgi:transcription termination factor Rho
LLHVLQNLTSESQTENDSQVNAIKSRISEVLNAFGLDSASEVIGLKPDERTEFIQKMSQRLNKGNTQIIVVIMSPPEDDFDMVKTIIESSVVWTEYEKDNYSHIYIPG